MLCCCCFNVPLVPLSFRPAPACDIVVYCFFSVNRDRAMMAHCLDASLQVRVHLALHRQTARANLTFPSPTTSRHSRFLRSARRCCSVLTYRQSSKYCLHARADTAWLLLNEPDRRLVLFSTPLMVFELRNIKWHAEGRRVIGERSLVVIIGWVTNTLFLYGNTD